MTLVQNTISVCNIKLPYINIYIYTVDWLNSKMAHSRWRSHEETCHQQPENTAIDEQRRLPLATEDRVNLREEHLLLPVVFTAAKVD